MIRDGSFSESFADVKYSQIKIICFTYQHEKVIKTCLNIRFKDVFNVKMPVQSAFCVHGSLLFYTRRQRHRVAV